MPAKQSDIARLADCLPPGPVITTGDLAALVRNSATIVSGERKGLRVLLDWSPEPGMRSTDGGVQAFSSRETSPIAVDGGEQKC